MSSDVPTVVPPAALQQEGAAQPKAADPSKPAEPVAAPAAGTPMAEAPPAAPGRRRRRKRKPRVKLSREERKERRRSLADEFLNAPNLITLARVFLIPLFSVWLARGDALHSVLATLTFAAASAMDGLDGWLARRMNKVTTVGKLLDPLADKLMVMSALVLLVRLDRVASWAVIVLLAREFIVTGLRSIASSEGLVISASQGGKWKTALQLIGLVGLLLHYPFPVRFPFWGTELIDFHRVGEVLLFASLIPSVTSAIGYFSAFVNEVTKRDTLARKSA